MFKVISKICLDTFKDFYKEPANIETVYKYNQRLTIYIRDLIYENQLIDFIIREQDA